MMNSALHVSSPIQTTDRCSVELTSLRLTQWARIRSRIGSISWLRFFSEIFPQPQDIRTLLPYGSHTSSKPYKYVDPDGPVVIILATGTEVRGFKPGWGRWIFSERKNPEYGFLRKGSKATGPASWIYGT